MPDGNGSSFTTRINGLDIYIKTYIAVARELRAVVPGVAFGPSNMAGISGGGTGAGGAGENCTACVYLNEFADRIRAAAAPLDFIAASEYSKWDRNGFAPVAPMQDNPVYLAGVAARSGNAAAPVEVHEWGWAGWGHWTKSLGDASWPSGAFGAAWDLGSYLYQRRGGCSKVLHWGYELDTSLNRGVRGRGGNASATCMPGTTWCSPADLRHGCVPTCRSEGYPIVTGHGWLLTALLRITGTREGSATLAEFVVDLAVPKRGATARSPYNHTVGAVKSFDRSRTRLSFLVVHFSPDPVERVVRTVRLELSYIDLKDLGVEGGCEGMTITQQPHNRTTSVPDMIEADLVDHNQKVAAEAHAVDTIGKMATVEGLARLVSEAETWMELNRRSLQPAPFEGRLVPTGSGGGCVLEFDMETPSLQLLELSGRGR